MNCPAPILAVGGQMKGTFALGSGRRAILSQHMGDLDHLEAFQAFQRDVRLYEQLFSLRPSCIVHDLHPDYASTRYAMQRAESEGIQRIAVQHHHAHLASCMAENGLSGPVLGVSFDGTGYGTDGKIWGGEFLLGDYRSFHRAAHLRYIPMPGGAMAVRQPWRMASAYLVDAGLTCETLEDRIPGATLEIVRHMLARRFNCPETSSVGRLFDAVASLIGVRDTVNHEGQAAMQLEWLAATVPPDGAYAYALESLPPASNMASWQLDMRPTIHGVVSDLCNNVEPARMARRFHSTIADAIVAICTKVRESSALDAIVLSGGVFMNVLLTREVMNKLSVNNFKVYRHRRVPPNDGGLCLGQLAVAASQMTPA
jgi:hydrogenase maturation protein HypF